MYACNIHVRKTFPLRKLKKNMFKLNFSVQITK